MNQWKTVKFGDVVRQIKDRVDAENCGLTEYTRGEHFESENLHLIGRSKLGDGQHGSAFHMRFQLGDVLYVSRNPHLRKVAVADYEGICANTTYILRADDENLIQELLPFVMQTEAFVEYTIQHKRGSTNFYLNYSDIEPYEFPIPPLDEQRRIAELLWAADDAIVEYQNVLSKLENLELSLTAQHTHPKNNWHKKQIKEFADVSYGLTIDSSRRNLKTERPYLRVANVWRNAFDFSEIKTIGFIEGDDKRYNLLVNDVLVVEGHANVDEIGRAALWVGQIDGCFHQNHILKIRVRNNKEIHPKFLLTFINSPTGKNYIKSRAKSTSGLNTINSTVLNMMEVPIPSYIEQVEILKSINEVENTKAITKSYLENSFALKKQLLTSLLRG